MSFHLHSYSSICSNSQNLLAVFNKCIWENSQFTSKHWYFNSGDPKVPVDFLNNSLSETSLFLVHSFQYLFRKRITQFERRAHSVVLLHCVKEHVRTDEKFIPFSARVALTSCDITYEQKKRFWFEEDNYYSICHDHIFKWIFISWIIQFFYMDVTNTLSAWEQGTNDA